jgi:hypothetical protein
MNKCSVITIIIALAAGQSSGLTFIGPPVATLEEGQLGIDGDYTFAELDIDLAGPADLGGLQDVELHSLFARFGYGINDNWECFARLGVAVMEGTPIDGDVEPAWGIGTKATLFTQQKLRIGCLFQIQSFKSDDELSIAGVSGDSEIDMYEFQAAIGAMYEAYGLKMYAGPFVNCVGGELDMKAPGGTWSPDIKEECEAGGFLGVAFEIRNLFNLCVEYLFTSDATGFGIGTSWLF